jgi:DNA-binding PadR family transcriptional regulator
MARTPKASETTLLRVLAVLLEAHKEGAWLHGIDVARKARKNTALVYPVLDRLHVDGRVTVDYDPPTCPARVRRQLYQLTAEGIASAKGFSEPGTGATP